MGPGANSSRVRGSGREHRVRAQAEGKSSAAITIETRVWTRTGATLSVGLNGRVLERGRVHAAAEGVHVATGVGI
jgi:hypothetical protein